MRSRHLLREPRPNSLQDCLGHASWTTSSLKEAADVIVSAITRRKAEVHVPREGAVVVAVLGRLPISSRRKLERLLGMKHGVRELDPAASSVRAPGESRRSRHGHAFSARGVRPAMTRGGSSSQADLSPLGGGVDSGAARGDCRRAVR